MTPSPTLQDLIEGVTSDAGSDDPLAQLAAAARTVADLEQTGDAVLGHFVDQCRRSGRSWSEISGALGVSKQAAHKRFSDGATPFERFTGRARTVVEGAGAQARRLGHGYVGTEHLLLALCEPAEGLGAQVLGEAGITRATAEEQVLTVIERGWNTGSSTRPFTPRAIETLRGAVEEALQLGHNYIGTEHLLLALFRDQDALASRVLSALGADRAKMKNRIVELLSGFTMRNPG